jgi:hypothetical protein
LNAYLFSLVNQIKFLRKNKPYFNLKKLEAIFSLPYDNPRVCQIVYLGISYYWGHKIVFIFIMQDIFIKSVVYRFGGANRCSPKGLRYPPASPPRLADSHGGQVNRAPTFFSILAPTFFSILASINKIKKCKLFYDTSNKSVIFTV